MRTTLSAAGQIDRLECLVRDLLAAIGDRPIVRASRDRDDPPEELFVIDEGDLRRARVEFTEYTAAEKEIVV